MYSVDDFLIGGFLGVDISGVQSLTSLLIALYPVPFFRRTWGIHLGNPHHPVERKVAAYKLDTDNERNKSRRAIS